MIINQVVSGGSGSSDPYQLLGRVKDDNNNEIGTVSGYFTDSSNQNYAVVCLDAQFRLAAGQWLSQEVSVTGMTNIPNTLNGVLTNVETATENCDKIMSFVGDGSTYTSSGVSHCRSKSFVIGGTTYYGQLPTILELRDIYINRSVINTNDPSATQYSSLIIPSSDNIWSSSQQAANYSWQFTSLGYVNYNSKDKQFFIIPVLEIPIA